MAVNGYKFSALAGGGAGALDSQDGATLNDGDVAIVTASGSLYVYQLDAASGAAESIPDVIAPDTNAGDKRWVLQRVPQTNTVPVGTIVAWFGGYFADGDNGGFVDVLGNDIDAANNILNADGWYVCDGSEINIPGSAVYDGTGRHLPNLTDSRFLCGSNAAGATGGSNSTSHTHNVDIPGFESGAHTLTLSEIPAHTHNVHALAYVWGVGTAADHGFKYDDTANWATSSSGGGGAHTHWVNPPLTATGGPSTTENRPQFLKCLYVLKVI